MNVPKSCKLWPLLAVFTGPSVWAANFLVVGTLISDPTDGQVNVKVEKGRQGLRVAMRWVNDFGMDVAGGNFPINVGTATVTLTINGAPQACSLNTITPAANACGFIASPFNSGGDVNTVKVFYNGNFPTNASVSVQAQNVKGNDATVEDPSNSTITFKVGNGTARPGSSIETVFDISGSMASPTVPAGTVARMDTLKHAAQALYLLLADHAMIGDLSGLVFFSTTASGGSLQAAHDPTVLSGQNGMVQGQVPTNTTAIGAGLSLATSAGLGADTNPRKFVLLFTDGEQNEPPPNGNVGISGAGKLQVGGSDYLAGVRVCPITAGQQSAPGFTLLQNIAHASCSDINLHIQDGGAQTLADSDIQTLLVQMLNDGLLGDKLEISQTSSADMAQGTTKTETFPVNTQDASFSILLSWSGLNSEGGPRILSFRLTAPDGTVVDTSGDTRFANRMSITTIRFPLHRNGATISPKGLWKMDLGGPNVPGVTYSLVVVNDSTTLATDVQLTLADPGTGEPIPMRVALTEGGAPLTGATVTAQLVGPKNGLGDILGKSPTPSGNPSQGGDPVGSAAKAKLLLLLQDPAFRALLADQPFPDVILTESSPGIYTGSFTGAAKEGHYQFVVRALGTTAANGAFQRLRRLSVFVRAKPDASKTDLALVSSILQPDGSSIIRIKATPRDRFGSLLGPDYLPLLAINSSVGSVSTPISDNLDGSYEIQYKVPAGSPPPDITVVVMGTVVKHLNGGGPGNQKWVISLHVGAAIPHSPLSNAFNTGPSVGGDLEYRFTKVFSAETFIGYDRFGAKAAGPDFWFVHLSEYAKLTFGTGPMRPFIDAGMGLYIDRNSGHFGGGAGGGLQYWIKPKIALEVSYNFHAVNTSGGATKYSTVLAGLRFAF